MNRPPADSSQVATKKNEPEGSTGRYGIAGYAIVLGLIFSILTGIGPYRALVGLGLIYVIYAVVSGRYSLRRMPRSHLMFYVALAAVWLVSQFYPDEVINHRAVKNILYALVIACTVNVLPRVSSLHARTVKKCVVALVGVIGTAVVAHTSVFYTEKAAAINRGGVGVALMFDGLFDNIHFLGLFCCFSLPALVLGWVWFRSWPARIAVAFVVTLDLALLFVSSSRPAWLTLAVVAILGCLLLLSKRAAWLAIGAAGAAIWGLVTLNLFGVGSRVASLVNNVMQEERILLWRDTVVALRDSSFLEVALGYGIGGYAYYSPSFSSDPRLAKLVFPHNFLLEWWYEIGLVGCLLLILGLGYVVISNLFSANPDGTIRRTQVIVGLTLSSVLLHGFFVLPFFYSRQILFLVTVLICFSFLVKDEGLSRVG